MIHLHRCWQPTTVCWYKQWRHFFFFCNVCSICGSWGLLVHRNCTDTTKQVSKTLQWISLKRSIYLPTCWIRAMALNTLFKTEWVWLTLLSTHWNVSLPATTYFLLKERALHVLIKEQLVHFYMKLRANSHSGLLQLVARAPNSSKNFCDYISPQKYWLEEQFLPTCLNPEQNSFSL